MRRVWRAESAGSMVRGAWGCGCLMHTWVGIARVGCACACCTKQESQVEGVWLSRYVMMI